MQIDGLITVNADDKQLQDRLAAMMGEAFLNEPYTVCFLDLIRAKDDQRIKVSTRIMETLVQTGAPVGRVYCTPDENVCLIGYQHSEQEMSNEQYEQLAISSITGAGILGEKQEGLVFLAQTMMGPVSDFDWYPSVVGEGGDFIHLVDAGVRVSEQGKGLIGNLFGPIFAYADERDLPVFLETFSDELEKLYQHFGFETLTIIESPVTPDLKERCMMRKPASAR